MEIITKAKFIEMIDASPLVLKSTQSKISLPIINRIHHKMKIGLHFPEIKIDDIFICDGHHRYVASICCGKKIGTIKTILAPSSFQIDWRDVDFVDEDWDSPSQLLKHNLSDANFNKIPLAQLLELLEL